MIAVYYSLNGVIIAFLHSSGILFYFNDAVNIRRSESEISDEPVFNNFSEIPSGPDAFEGSSSSNSFFILFIVKVISDISGCLAPLTEGVFPSSLGKTLLNWLFKISAIS